MVMSNPFDEAIELYWMPPDGGDPPSMGQILAGESMNVNTFAGHVFGYRKETEPNAKMMTLKVKAEMDGKTMELPSGGAKSSSPKNKPNKKPTAKRVKKRTASAATVDTKGLGGLSFRNLADRTLILYWKNTGSGEYKFQGQLGSGDQTGFQTYPGHQFIWSEQHSDPPVPIGEFTIEAGKLIYTFTDKTTTKAALDRLNEELEFRKSYLAENGYDWIGTTWPRPAPTLWMHRPTEIGEITELDRLTKKAQQYHCSSDTHSECLATNKKSLNKALTSQSDPEKPLELETISIEPRVFRIKNFLSEFEADYIISQAKPQLARSTTGHGKNTRVDDVRTSKSAWLSRGHSKVMDAIYRRIGLATNIPQEIITESKIAENLNVLNYPAGGEYTPHYDIGADGLIASRFISGLLYLNDPEEGGGTTFPKAKRDDGDEGIYVDAVKGSFVFFYDLLEDGNVDVRSLHSGSKVIKGEKWVSPLWLWEPSRTGKPHGLGDLSQLAIENEDLTAHEEL